MAKSTRGELWLDLHNHGKTFEEIADLFDVKRKSVVDAVRRHLKKTEGDHCEKLTEHVIHEEKNDEEIFPIMVIGDTHIPFEHPNYLQFCKDVKEKYGCKTVVHVGDLADNHYPSRHNTEVDAYGGEDEYNKTYNGIQKWIEAFPEVYYCIGNHDKIPERQAAVLGLGKGFIKSFREQWDIPHGWKCGTEHIIGNVLFTHGINCLGKNGSLNLAIQERMSSVIGHAHSVFGVSYNANPRDIIFGLSVGCGIDVKSYAMRYGKHYKLKPILGCGVVLSPTEAYSVPMSEKYFRN